MSVRECVCVCFIYFFRFVAKSIKKVKKERKREREWTMLYWVKGLRVVCGVVLANFRLKPAI